MKNGYKTDSGVSFDIDPSRVGIMGGSFGGYSTMHALCNLSNETDTERVNYRCGCSFVGCYEAGKLFLDKPCFRGDPLITQYWHKVFGPLYMSSEEEGKKVSPAHHGSRVKVPVLMMHGEDDPRCPVSVAEEFARSIGPELCELWKFGGEGHGIQREVNRLLMWSLVDRHVKDSL